MHMRLKWNWSSSHRKKIQRYMFCVYIIPPSDPIYSGDLCTSHTMHSLPRTVCVYVYAYMSTCECNTYMLHIRTCMHAHHTSM